MRTLKHASIGIIVEGIAGIYDGATIDQERVFLLQRKGFIKCAIQAGVGTCSLLSVILFREIFRPPAVVPGLVV